MALFYILKITSDSLEIIFSFFSCVYPYVHTSSYPTSSRMLSPYYVPDIVLVTFDSPQQPYAVTTIIIHISHMRKLRLRKVPSLIQSNWRSQDLNSIVLHLRAQTPKPLHFNSLLLNGKKSC